MTTWTSITKASGPTWTMIANASNEFITNAGIPYGFLLLLTNPSQSMNVSGWTSVSKATGTSWTSITKAT